MSLLLAPHMGDAFLCVHPERDCCAGGGCYLYNAALHPLSVTLKRILAVQQC
jgi:hypothetical protein